MTSSVSFLWDPCFPLFSFLCCVFRLVCLRPLTSVRDPILFLFMTYYRVCHKTTTMCATCVYPFVLLLLAIRLSVFLRITASEYSFAILKLFCGCPFSIIPSVSFIFSWKICRIYAINCLDHQYFVNEMAIEHSVGTQQYLIYSKILGIQTYFVEFADLQKQ